LNINPKFDINPNYNYAFIYNLDKYRKPGSHWVAIYVDNNPESNHSKSVEFYDSYGISPPKELDDYIRSQFQGYKYKINRVRHQGLRYKNKLNTLCGNFACLFIARRVNGYSFAEATNYKPSNKRADKEFENI